MPRDNEQQFLVEVLRGDENAIAFCNILFRISQVLDDLIDGDKPVSQQQLMDSYWHSLVTLPANTFYRSWEPELRPMIAMVLQDYIDSVTLERTDQDRHKVLAFVLRDQLTSIVVQCARLVGGLAWMRAVSPKIRDHFHEDELADYIASITPAQPDSEEQEAES